MKKEIRKILPFIFAVVLSIIVVTIPERLDGVTGIIVAVVSIPAMKLAVNWAHKKITIHKARNLNR